MRKFLNFVFRIDNFNRIIVLISMVLFIVMPSWLLFLSNDDNYSFNTVMPCVLMLGLILGNGLLAIYRPLRTTFVYFLNMIVGALCISRNFEYSQISFNFSIKGIFATTLVYASLGALINLFYFFYYLSHRNKNTADERTNNDTWYDFLGGEIKNNQVADMLDKIDANNNKNQSLIEKVLKQNKLSKILRIVSYALTVIITGNYLLSLSRDGVTSSQLQVICILVLLIVTISFVASLLFPKDFKYVYYYNAFFLLLMGIVSCNDANEGPIGLVLTIIAVGISFLVTLIVEGRTWTGAKPN